MPQMKLLGDTADITHLRQFKWYQYIWYIHLVEIMDSKHIGCYLGPTHCVGDVMCSKVLTAKATILVRRSVYPLMADDLATAGVKTKLGEFNASLKEKLQHRHAGVPEEVEEVPDYIPDEVPSEGKSLKPMLWTMRHMTNIYQLVFGPQTKRVLQCLPE
jgi:hypothetical protein